MAGRELPLLLCDQRAEKAVSSRRVVGFHRAVSSIWPGLVGGERRPGRKVVPALENIHRQWPAHDRDHDLVGQLRNAQLKRGWIVDLEDSESDSVVLPGSGVAENDVVGIGARRQRLEIGVDEESDVGAGSRSQRAGW